MRKILATLLLIMASLACQKTPDYVVRGWTETPSAVVGTSTLPVGPTIILVTATPAQYEASVIADILEIRKGPGTKYPSSPDYLSKGETILVMECQYDQLGEAWVRFVRIRDNLTGWSAVTQRNSIFIRPMPGRCE